MTRIYLDYNATAPMLAEVKHAMTVAMDMIGNPSSVHTFGRGVRKEIEQARNAIATTIGCDPTHITFTSGATEANNWTLLGTTAKRILVSAIEHPSVMDVPVKRELIPVTKSGTVDTHGLEQLLQQSNEPTLVSILWANNETGVIQLVEEILSLCRRYGALLHVDAVQALGRIPIDLRQTPIDFLSLSAHKIGGPSGIGALVYNHDVTLNKLLHGGGQERRRRAGTENFLGIVGFGAAVRIARDTPTLYTKLGQWRDALEDNMLKTNPNIILVGKDVLRVGNTVQFITPNIPAEKLLMALDLAGIAVSSGSACSSGSIRPSTVLLNMGYTESLARCALRLSMGPQTTESDLTAFFDAWVANSQRIISS